MRISLFNGRYYPMWFTLGWERKGLWVIWYPKPTYTLSQDIKDFYIGYFKGAGRPGIVLKLNKWIKRL
jgi:hypothetical protein